MDSNFIIGEHDPETARRVIAKGHSTRRNRNVIECICGWSLRESLLLEREEAEYLAWLHVSKPQLIIAESSDVQLHARQMRAGVKVPPSVRRMGIL